MGKIMGFGKGQQGNTLRLNYKNYFAEIGLQNGKFVFYVNDAVVHNLGTIEADILLKSNSASPTFTGTVTLPDVVHSGHIDGQVFTANSFGFDDPTVKWTPSQFGAALPASNTASQLYIPLNFLKVGDEIVSYKLFGDATEAAALTLDCKLIKTYVPHTSADVAGGAITQIVAAGNFASVCTLTAPITVTAANQYSLFIVATTGIGDSIYVNGSEVTINRK